MSCNSKIIQIAHTFDCTNQRLDCMRMVLLNRKVNGAGKTGPLHVSHDCPPVKKLIDQRNTFTKKVVDYHRWEKQVVY